MMIVVDTTFNLKHVSKHHQRDRKEGKTEMKWTVEEEEKFTSNSNETFLPKSKWKTEKTKRLELCRTSKKLKIFKMEEFNTRWRPTRLTHFSHGKEILDLERHEHIGNMVKLMPGELLAQGCVSETPSPRTPRLSVPVCVHGKATRRKKLRSIKHIFVWR